MVKLFVVSEDHERTGEPLTLTLASDHEIGISGKDGPLFSLRRRDDGQWYLSSYYDRKSQKSIFAVEGMNYEELQKMIANSRFQYQVENDLLREVLRGSINELAVRVYDQIREQVDLKTLNRAGFYLSHAAIAYREEGPLKYLICGMIPYGVDIYDSIFSALLRHLSKHGELTETDLSISISINVPLTGESVTVRHPLLKLRDLSFEEIQRLLKETGSDVRVPEITIRKGGGYELRAKAWVYETLLKLKDLGFDAVLGKTMAEEFNRQAARIYVESALADLGFLAKDYQREKPLAALLDRQQRLYSKALELNFSIPLDSNYYLAKKLFLPLTWEKEQELLDFLRRNLKPEDLKKFYDEIGINDEYFQTRDVVETFLDFASDWGWSQFDRSNEFPTYQYQSTRYRGGFFSGMRILPMTRSGEYAVSTQAQERFKVAKKTWNEFLTEVKQKSSRLLGPQLEKIDAILKLGNDLVVEIDRMSQAEVTEWAEKIINGEMAAVGRDIQKSIEVKTWRDFYQAIEQLMNTARLVLIYRSKEGRFGFEVSTDKEDLS